MGCGDPAAMFATHWEAELLLKPNGPAMAA
jgi:hypothetical protein